MSPREIQAAAHEQLAEQTRRAQQAAEEARRAAENARYEADRIRTARA